MSQGRGRGRSNRSALSETDAFELCHPDVREALRTCVFEWSAAWALNYQRKHGTAATIELLRKADENSIRTKPWMKGVKSPTVSARMKPLYPCGCTP